MKYFVIADNNDTHIGMRLAGIEGTVAHTPQQVEQQLRTLLADESIGVVLITEKLAQLCSDLIYQTKMSVSRPLILEIPDRHGSRTKDSITRYVREAVGVKF